jgi:hypothetical protein
MPEINVNIKIEGLKELTEALKKWPQISVKHIDDGIKKSLYEIEREAKPRTPVSEGRLRGSYRTDLKPLHGEVGPTVDYAAFVHEGTRPHWPPWGPGTALERWARFHGIQTFLVARKIAFRGTKAQPFLLEGVKAAVPAIEKRMKEAMENLLNEIVKMTKT